MAHTLVFTGSAGPGIALAAAATALHAADSGQRTLLLSLGAPQSLGALLDAPLASEPRQIAPRLDALALDALADLAAAWERGRARMPPRMAQVAGDELPLVPGLEMAFGLLRLRELAPRYDLVVVDAGAHDMLLRALAIPDGLRWATRLAIGLDRGPGRSADSVARALLPTSLLPPETIGNIQELRIQIERLRGVLTAPGAATARYVLRPDRPAIEEARLAIAGLQLHGLAVPSLACGPLLPHGLDGTPLAALATQQSALLAEAAAVWPTRRKLQFDLLGDSSGLAALRRIGARLYADRQPVVDSPIAPPIAETWQGAPAVAIELPGLPANALQITLSGDELIVRVGPYRRHILPPEGLRGVANIKATREGERLIIRRRS